MTLADKKKAVADLDQPLYLFSVICINHRIVLSIA